jgi:Carboxypeptidase regulatory-like domain
MYRSREPFFFTTPSDLQVDEDATVDFGIGFSLSGLMGQVLNDARQGVAGVTVAIRSRGRKWSAITEADGSFFVSSLEAGDYDVLADEDSLPVGYAGDSFAEQRVTVGATSPGKADFTARAFRSISGRVLSYDPAAARYVPVVAAKVTLYGSGFIVITDPMGRYLFRDLAAGSYTLSVQNDPQTSVRTVQLGGQPVDLANVDFQISVAAPSHSPLAVLSEPRGHGSGALSEPRASASGEPKPLPDPETGGRGQGSEPRALPTGAAQQHNLLGRQHTKAGRYREAIVELTEALRIAPDFALAFNARGFAEVMLHDWARAIEDLNQAIRLNPAYANAYYIRAIARRAAGDAPGAAADLKASQQFR